MDDMISRQAAINALGEEPPVWYDGEDELAERYQWRRDVAAIKALPSAQPVVISKSENATECEDAVSREAVLNEIHRYMEERDYTIGLLDDNVCGLPPVTPKQPGWIPCSERCPEQSGWYLVSLKNGNVQKAWYRVAPINQGGSYWRSPIKRPLAWMPLPTPYREGGQDGKN